jgi:hypothetical protein
MKLELDTIDNILSMLNSEDIENGFVAFKAIESHKLTNKDFGTLMYLFKFSKHKLDEWEQHAPDAHKILSSHITGSITYANALNLIIKKKAPKEVIDKFLERHVKDLAKTLISIGYPEELEIKINYKA